MTTILQCIDCNTNLDSNGGCFSLFSSNYTKAASCTKCQTSICSKCAGDQALIPYDPTTSSPSSRTFKKSDIISYCKACYQEVSVLDYTKTYDIIEPTTTDTTANCNMTLLWVHGGGASRALFRSHAQELASKGYRSILIDLPGHGTLVDTPLTLDSCVEIVRDVVDKECSDSSKAVCYIGASLGAYIGFYILSKLQTKFTSSILLDCGQNVGPDCSHKARFGLWFLRKLSSSMSNKSLMSAMMSQSTKTADYHIHECSFGSGMFFQQGAAQCDCLHSVAPADLIPTLNIPILYFNGSEDHRDSENKWLELCKDERSELKVYDGGDHFFCHDIRFVDDMLERMHKFIQAV